ncbi:MAG: hemerythrin domain-containing protein [Myxococcales bacterium]|jgi:iron-sulfur cluster repair protein YtfE (RIC family)
MTHEHMNQESPSTFSPDGLAPESAPESTVEAATHDMAAALATPAERTAPDEGREPGVTDGANAQAAQDDARRDPAVDLLACHEKLRRFIELSASLAAGKESPESVAASAAAIYDFLMVSLPIHMADEDYAIAPKLRTAGAPDVVQQALEVLAYQHSDLQAMIGRMASTWRTLAEQPERLPELASRLESGTARLAAVLEAHLALEEEMLIPALEKHLAPETRALIAREIRLRPSA